MIAYLRTSQHRISWLCSIHACFPCSFVILHTAIRIITGYVFAEIPDIAAIILCVPIEGQLFQFAIQPDLVMNGIDCIREVKRKCNTIQFIMR